MDYYGLLGITQQYIPTSILMALNSGRSISVSWACRMKLCSAKFHHSECCVLIQETRTVTVMFAGGMTI